MTDMKLSELKEKEQGSGHLEQTVKGISGEVKKASGGSPPFRVFCVAYMAYLAADNGIRDTAGLIRLAGKSMDEKQEAFVAANIDDLWWLSVRLGKTYGKESLAAAVLWMPVPRDGRWKTIKMPEGIMGLAARLLDGDGGSIADFCCRDGSFLLDAYMSGSHSSYTGVGISAEDGIIASIRMSVASSAGWNLRQDSVFDLGMDEKFDRIFCGYRWGIKRKNIIISDGLLDILAGMIPGIRNVRTADWLFIANALLHLADGGRAVIIVPDTVAAGGGMNADIREQFIKAGFLEAVISPPCSPYNPPKALLFVLSRGNKGVRMIDACSMFPAGKERNVIGSSMTAEIASLMEKDAVNSAKASFGRLKEHGYAVSPSKYSVMENMTKNGVEFDGIIKKMTRGTQMKASDLNELVTETQTDIRYLALANIQGGIVCGELPCLKGLEKKLEKYCIKDNSLLISKSGTPLKVAVASVQEGQKILANGNLYVIELDEKKANPYFLKAYLESHAGNAALLNIMVGAAVPNIPVDSLRRMRIPLPPIEEQNRIADKYMKVMNEAEDLRERLERKMEELKSVFPPELLP